MKPLFYVLGLTAWFIAGPVIAGPDDVFGVYLLEDKGSIVEISDCGDGTPCGNIVWVDPESVEPEIEVEQLKSKAGERIIGLQILKGFERFKKGWRGGTIYSPRVDKTYSSKLKRLDDGSLQVKGCIAFFCQTQIWTETVIISN